MKKLPVFVYGTLRNGLGNYERLLKGQTVAEHAALTTGTLLSVGAYPALLEFPKSEEVIKGELMFIKPEVYEETLRSLDWLEGYYKEHENNSLYLRKKVRVYDETAGKYVDAWGYYWNRSKKGLKLIACGCWKEYKEQQQKPKQQTKAEKEWDDLWKMDVKF